MMMTTKSLTMTANTSGPSGGSKATTSLLDSRGNEKGRGPSVLVIGAGYAGMTLAIRLTRPTPQEEREHCGGCHPRWNVMVVDRLAPPDAGSLVGNIRLPSAHAVLKKLGLQLGLPASPTTTGTTNSDTTRPNDLYPEEDLLMLLRSQIDIRYRCFVTELEECDIRDGSENAPKMYAIVRARQHDNAEEPQEERLGPFDLVVVANGVMSSLKQRHTKIPSSSATTTTRRTENGRIAMIGDVRWVRARWWDYGTKRIREGANVAMRDGLDLAELLLSQLAKDGSLPNQTDLGIYCAADRVRPFSTRQRLFTVIAVIVAILVAVFQSKTKR